MTTFRAPHKPLLLLAILDLAAGGLLHDNIITMNNDLTETFRSYWRAILPGTKGSIILPFFHMNSQSFWHLLPKAGKEHEAAAIRQVGSWKQFDALFDGARLDDELFLYIHESSAREILRATLLTTYFVPEAAERLQQRSDITTDIWRYSEYLFRTATEQVAESTTVYRVRPAARQQGFRRCIIHSYDDRCVQCGIRVRTPQGYSVIDAAHIIPWYISRNDSPVNGLALCKLCHWLFDTGLTGITSSYTLLLSPQIFAESNLPGHLSALEGHTIFLPAMRALYPSPDALEWHRKEVYRHKAG